MAPAPLTRGIVGLVGAFAVSGTTHLVRPEVFEPIMPSWVPAHRTVVYASGVVELVCAAGLVAPPTRRVAGYASALLLLGVWPANGQMTVTAFRRWRRSPRDVRRGLFLAGTVARLPLQWPLIRVALSATDPRWGGPAWGRRR